MKYGVICVLLVCCSTAMAGTIVRFTTSMGNIDVELYDARTPLTAANFLSYLPNYEYNWSFIHRSVPGFVIQGGGFGFDDISQGGPYGWFVDDGSKPTVQNEPGISNTRGTIAMAKLGGDPDSATSQWFFNLGDNSANLDYQNGGFTVFGHVLDNGMDVVDAIADLPVYDMSYIYGAFDELPLMGDSFDTNNLVMVWDVSVLNFLPGDANRDGRVNVIDLSALASNYNKTANANLADADFNGDGRVNVIDLGMLAMNYGAGASAGIPAVAPEPLSLSLLGAGVLGLIRRRK